MASGIDEMEREKSHRFTVKRAVMRRGSGIFRRRGPAAKAAINQRLSMERVIELSSQ
jgi:IS4 transposase